MCVLMFHRTLVVSANAFVVGILMTDRERTLVGMSERDREGVCNVTTRQSVCPDLAKLRHFGKISKVFGNFLMAFGSILPNF